jgi:GH15 family glucan-1,4-alpha-glucosidase
VTRAELLRRSVEVIRAGQAPTGAYVASPAYAVYGYSWLRDGAFIADAMSRAGEAGSAEAFFGWCARLLVARRDAVEGGGRLDARYTVDGQEPPGPWSGYQLDGYGAWLWALDAHERRHGRPVEDVEEGAALSADYIEARWREPCFDWWEEREGLHPATLAAIAAGLRAQGRGRAADEVAAFALDRGILERLDASLLACGVPFGLVDPAGDEMARAVEAIERELVVDRGVHRHREDVYYGGGLWLLLAGFLGLHYAAVGRRDDAEAELEWIEAQATPEGDLPEQVATHLLHPEEERRWAEEHGPSPCPLLWSHAMYLVLTSELGQPRG